MAQDIRDVTQESLRSSMAVVPQDISLFHRSVLENIRYARPDATEAEVLAAADMAHCREFIEALPEGFETMVGDRGVKLSGGQRQRLAIARALLKDAPILLLDEATSALDTESEQAIQEALDRLMHGRTVIAIAHRLSTLQSFDRIIVMDHGRIIDDGPPGVLAARPGPYRELLRKQQRWSRWPPRRSRSEGRGLPDPVLFEGRLERLRADRQAHRGRAKRVPIALARGTMFSAPRRTTRRRPGAASIQPHPGLRARRVPPLRSQRDTLVTSSRPTRGPLCSQRMSDSARRMHQALSVLDRLSHSGRWCGTSSSSAMPAPAQGRDTDEARIAAAMPRQRRAGRIGADGRAGLVAGAGAARSPTCTAAPMFAHFTRTPEGRDLITRHGKLLACVGGNFGSREHGPDQIAVRVTLLLRVRTSCVVGHHLATAMNDGICWSLTGCRIRHRYVRAW